MNRPNRPLAGLLVPCVLAILLVGCEQRATTSNETESNAAGTAAGAGDAPTTDTPPDEDAAKEPAPQPEKTALQKAAERAAAESREAAEAVGDLAQEGAAVAREQAGRLSEQLSALAERSKERLDEFTRTTMQNATDALRESGLLQQSINVGDTAPQFTLPNTDGADIALEKLLEQGPVVLVFYRGGWCPYCVATLKAYDANADAFAQRGATLVAISPQVPDQSEVTRREAGLDMLLLSDVGNTVAREYNLVFELDGTIRKIYQDLVGLETFNGDESYELPLAATYVIDRDGVVQYAFIDADYRKRAEPSAVLAALDELNQSAE